MLDISWQELFIIAVLTIVIIGPKELPRVLRAVTVWSRKIRAMAREFQQGLDDLAREAELDELRRELKQASQIDLDRELEHTIDPDGTIRDTVREIGEPLDTAEPASERPTRTTADAPGPDASAVEAETTPDRKKIGGAS